MAITPSFTWQNQQNIQQRKFTCGHSGCGREVASNLGWFYHNNSNNRTEALVYVCPMCHCPTFFDDTISPSVQIPGVSFGRSVAHLPHDVGELYEEIRKTTSIGSYTATVLACRKLLMHVAVEKGAKDGQDFIKYVEYLADNHYAPPGSKPWVDKIRKSGNEANHEIKIMTKEVAEELVNFAEMLLKFIYEFPAKLGSGAEASPMN